MTRGCDGQVPKPTPDSLGILPETTKVGTLPTDTAFGVRSESLVGVEVRFFGDSGSVDADRAARGFDAVRPRRHA